LSKQKEERKEECRRKNPSSITLNLNLSRPRSGNLARRAGGLTAVGLDEVIEDEDSLHESMLVEVISQ
jgi:hypothetical protein